MDIPTLVTSTVALLSPYFVKGSEAFAKKVGDKAFASVGKMAALIKDKVSGPAEEALADLERDPENDENQADLRKQLKKALEADPAFAEEVQTLVKDIQTKGGAPVTQIMNVTGDQNKSTQISGSGNTVNM